MNRKIILIFFLTITISAALFLLVGQIRQRNSLSEASKQALLKEQQLFADWYEDYNYNLEQLDFNWKQYHRISGDLREEIINSETAYHRLEQLARKQAGTVKAIRDLIPPLSFREELYDLTAALYHKQLKYAEAQQRVIALSKNALDPDAPGNETDEILSQRIDEICVAEAPAAIFSAEEIYAIRNYLTLPDEK